MTLERLEDRIALTGGLVNVGELLAPDPNIKSMYAMALDSTTGIGYWGAGGAIAKVDLTGALPVLVSENTTGFGGATGFTAGVVDTSNPDPTQHYLYVGEGHSIVKYSPGSGSQAPQPLANVADPNSGFIWNAVIDKTTGYAYFGAQAGSQNYVIRLRLSDFTLQGIEWIGTLPNSTNLGQNAAFDTIRHIIYYSSDGVYPSLEKVDVTSFTNGATNVGTNFDLGSKIDAVDPHYAGIMPNCYGANLVFDQAHDLLYVGTYSFDSSTEQVNNNAWPYNQATVVRIDPTGAGAGFASSVISTLDLQPGQRNLSVAAFDPADGDIIYATDNTYPMHVYRIHVGDGSQPMQEIGALVLNGGSLAPFADGTSHPEATPATQGEIFARSACFYSANFYIGTDTSPGQFIKIGVAPNQAATLQSISITPVSPSVAQGSTQQFTATGNFSDGSKQDLTGNVTWSSTNPAVAGINAAGRATALIVGQTTISASSGAVTASTLLTSVSSPNAAFVSALYRDFLKRTADIGNASGAGSWVNSLNSNTMTPATVANAIIHSGEALGVMVDGLYLKLLSRPSDPGGRASFVSFLQNGGTVEQVITIMVTSPEYNGLAGSASGFIQSLYNKLLGRTASSGEVASWLGYLQTAGEAAVARAFLSSGEFRGDLVQELYGTPAPSGSVASLFPNLLLRTAPPSAAEVTSWANSGLDILTITVDFAGSAEFFKDG